MTRATRAWARTRVFVLAITTALIAVAVTVPAPASASYPALPLSYDATFVSNVSAPTLAPGSSGTLSFFLGVPANFSLITAVMVTLQVYAFNAYPGNSSSTIATAGTPLLVTPQATATSVNLSLSSLEPGGVEEGSVGVVTSDNTPAGTFAVRTALTFQSNGVTYVLESRGWFSASLWAKATELPGGAATLNLSVLGVSGVTAETAILITSSNWDLVLAVILGVSFVLVGAGAFVYFRRGPKSSSGAR